MKWTKAGKAPDYRFSLANERTFLAWIRTSLAFLAAAIGVDQLVPDLATVSIRGIISIALCLFSGLLALYAYIRWLRNEKAMRFELDLPYSKTLFLISLFMGIITFVVIFFIKHQV